MPQVGATWPVSRPNNAYSLIHKHPMASITGSSMLPSRVSLPQIGVARRANRWSQVLTKRASAIMGFMKETLQDIASKAAVLCALMGVACWALAIVNMFRMVRHRKPGVPLFPNAWESPFNIMFRPGNLTDRGLRARKLTFLGTVGFVVCWFLAGGFGLLSGTWQ